MFQGGGLGGGVQGVGLRSGVQGVGLGGGFRGVGLGGGFQGVGLGGGFWGVGLGGRRTSAPRRAGVEEEGRWNQSRGWGSFREKEAPAGGCHAGQSGHSSPEHGGRWGQDRSRREKVLWGSPVAQEPST